MKKPANLIYGLDDIPPPAATLGNALQHVALISINVVYPLLIFRAAGVATDQVANLIAIGFFVLGAGTFLQWSRRTGSGFMCPSCFTGAYLSPSLMAAKLGGLPLLFGMTIFAGVIEMLLAPLLNRLRAIFPTEISGLVIFMIGLGAGIAAVRSLTGVGAAPVTSAEWWVAGVTLATMIGLNVWGQGMARMLCALIGLIARYAATRVRGSLKVSTQTYTIRRSLRLA